MKSLKYLVIVAIAIAAVISCSPDDDDPGIVIRDAREVFEEDLDSLTKFLSTHTWNSDELDDIDDGDDFEIEFSLIEDGDDSTPLIDQVETRTLTRDDIDYTYYILKAREGDGENSATFADSALVSYSGKLLDLTQFDNSINSLWFDLPSTIDGFAVALEEFKEADSSEPQDDGTINFNGSGIGAVFMPSGIAYFNGTPTGIPAYSPIIFTFKVRRVKTTDHDGDGIFSKFEDLNDDRDVRTGDIDNTDEDFILNNQGRRIGQRFNYLDEDDDNDGIPTRDENPDPNGDGNPEDAQDSDNDGIPDYLDDATDVTTS
ncbi:FKBP-type peptidyl-prolyl cis-trans isomerase [Nonlabens ponticola]|uniref:Peptidylprolyl isomerase n=1 Tax=Nonlabens ponticola TaxID=2496866 RepID=A0A3S9N017_9FLAO|nr:peptidylprolyl isomerase [Nonlabens ponticola]AZQ44886.1 peptidylprolyl isomerase [Nonlabens ponticola]